MNSKLPPLKQRMAESLPVLGQRPENPKTLGLFAAGQCQECKHLVFYHGAHGLAPKIYTCCGRDCDHQMSLKVPGAYSGKLERIGVEYVFQMIDELQKGTIVRACDHAANAAESGPQDVEGSGSGVLPDPVCNDAGGHSE